METGYWDSWGDGYRIQTLNWTIAARRQLDRWERLLAAKVWMELRSQPAPNRLVWEVRSEHHLACVALAHVVMAMKKAQLSLDVGADFLQRLTAVRDLLEHWDENLPVFNGNEGDPKYRSGRWFAEAHPGRTPYLDASSWGNRHGPMLTADTPATEVRAFLDAAEMAVLAARPQLADFLPPRAESPWYGDEVAPMNRWYPKQPAEPAP